MKCAERRYEEKFLPETVSRYFDKSNEEGCVGKCPRQRVGTETVSPGTSPYNPFRFPYCSVAWRLAPKKDASIFCDGFLNSSGKGADDDYRLC